MTRTAVVSITPTGQPAESITAWRSPGGRQRLVRVLVVREQAGRRGLLTRQDRPDELIAQRSREGELNDGQVTGGHGGHPTGP